MADLDNITAEWTGVYQLEREDPVLGGPPNPATGDGIDNVPHMQLANRTAWLRQELERLTEAANVLQSLLAVDGAGSRLDADTVDGKHASAFILLSDLLARIRMIDGTGSGIDSDMLDGRHAREFFPKSGGTVDGNTSVNGNLGATGTVSSHGGECLVWSSTSYDKDTIVLARYDGSIEKKYGAEVDGSLLQACSASGDENHGSIGIGGWKCLGFARGSAATSPADNVSLWARIF